MGLSLPAFGLTRPEPLVLILDPINPDSILPLQSFS